MADAPQVRTQPLDRAQINALAGGDPRIIKFLENLGYDVATVLPQATQQAAQDAEDASGEAGTANTDIAQLRTPSYLTLGPSTYLNNERTLTAGGTTNISIVDGGGGFAATLSVALNPQFRDANSNVVVRISNSGATPQLSFFGATPIARPTNAIPGAAFLAGAGTPVLAGSTFDGYTVSQVVSALRNLGILT